jgi:alanyl-tRNA synthetase/REP element-mobilizing transposase RayT
MTSAQIRQSFLDFFKSKGHTIVPSSSLMPDSPNLLFTNAGMNQFVPIFLGQRAPDVTKWAGAIPASDTRAADTQKCIRAGGKHNDLEDVGLDTYHHTFFEMLGNWSFGDYFKKEAIEWAWELITEVWKFPKERLYATVYSPDKAKGDPSDFDQEAYDVWAEKFRVAGLDPKVHIINGNKKDNFWMMGDTGPCGPCSELHVDLTPNGDTNGSLVNKGDARCIEIWNLVFIQFNANPDGTFTPLPARHIDTGMGFERVTGIIQNTRDFTDFTRTISNYETDIFRPVFDRIEKLSGKKYGSTLPGEHTRPRVSQSAPSPIASGTTETKYSRRNLPHFERPWTKYMISFSTRERRQLSPSERDIALASVLHAHEHHQYQLYAACVMPDHVHLLFEPQIKGQDKEAKPVFWSLSDILQGIKSASAHNINKASGQKGVVWEKESLDRMIRGQSDMEEKFHYICRNPWDSGVVPLTEDYRWLWTPDRAGEHTHPCMSQSTPSPVPDEPSARAQTAAREGACAPPAQNEQEKIDVAFRVIADHIRTLSFAIADGIQPGNTDRNYVLRRILRRAVRYGRTLGFHEPFFYKLVSVLADTMGHVFAELRAKQDHIEQVIQREEEAFNRTLDKGIKIFDEALSSQEAWVAFLPQVKGLYQRIRGVSDVREVAHDRFRAIHPEVEDLYDQTVKLKLSEAFPQGSNLEASISALSAAVKDLVARPPEEFNRVLRGFDKVLPWMHESLDSIERLRAKELSGDTAFKLYDTYGFPLDLTELMARERGWTVDAARFDLLMEKQKKQSQAAQKKQVIELSQVETTAPTQFVGYDKLEAAAKVLEVVGVKDKTAVILNTSPLYAEMGGQVGDTGEMSGAGELWTISNTQKAGDAWLHFLEDKDAPAAGMQVQLSVDRPRREAIQRHHTVTHLLHWALHEVVSADATQKGSYVGPEKLTFDFSGAPLTPQQVADVERLVNERILENAPVTWTEAKYADIKSRKDIMQFFGEKYGDVVRVVQIGGKPAALDGYWMELCGGTHTHATGEIGLFRIAAESAIAAGIRRIEAVSGLEAYKRANEDLQLIKAVAGKVNSPVGELEKKIESLLAQQKELEKQLKGIQQKQAGELARSLAAKAQTIGSTPAIIENLGAADGDFLQSIADALKGQFKGVVVLGGTANNAVALVATVSADLTKKVLAGKIIQTIAPTVGGKGGGRPDNARGGGKDTSKLDEALAKAKALLG